MKIFIYSIYDKVAGGYGDLKLFSNEASAKRWFEHLSSTSPFGRDLALYKLGVFDVDTGIISDVDVIFVMNFVNALKDGMKDA